MKELKEKDILKFLEGSLSDEEKKRVTDWTDASDTNRRDMDLYKVIHSESAKLESFNIVDEIDEWKEFQDRSAFDIQDIDILNHLDGFSNKVQSEKIQSWAVKSRENQRDMDIYSLLYNDAPKLSDYKEVNADLEWSKFQDSISLGAKPEESKPQHAGNFVTKMKVIPMWQRYAVAAAVSLLIAVVIWMNMPRDPYGELIAGDQGQTIVLEDGSVVELAAYSTLRYPKSVKDLDERRLYLNGEGKFNVAENKEKPFYVEIENEDPQKAMGVHVLGTIFTVSNDSAFVKVVENIEGLVRVYKLTDADIKVDLEKGDKFGFDGQQFVDMKPEIVEVDNAKEYQILYVIDYLMEVSDWKVITAPYSEFDEEAVVEVDLEKPYEDVLVDLETRADFDYTPLTCEGCYIIRKFTPKQQP